MGTRRGIQDASIQGLHAAIPSVPFGLSGTSPERELALPENIWNAEANNGPMYLLYMTGGAVKGLSSRGDILANIRELIHQKLRRSFCLYRYTLF